MKASFSILASHARARCVHTLLAASLTVLSGCQVVMGFEDTHVVHHDDAGLDDDMSPIEAEDAGHMAPDDMHEPSPHDAGPDAQAPDAASDDGDTPDRPDETKPDAGPTQPDAGVDAGATEPEPEPDAGADEPDIDPTSADRVFRSQHTWPKRPLFVRLDPYDVRFAARVEELLESTWGRVADLNFVGFDAYHETINGYYQVVDLLIRVRTDRPSDAGLGFPGFWQAREVFLNPDDNDPTLLHALGRSLGFENEFGIRAAQTDCRTCNEEMPCEADELCLPSGYCGKPYLHQSVMAAPDCGGIESDRPFSVWDAWGAQRAYGLKPSGSLVTSRGLCAHAGEPGASSWAGVCDDAREARFELAPRGVGHALMTAKPGVCLSNALDGASSTETVPLTSASCDASSAQSVTLEGVQLMAVGSSCVGVGSATDGAGLVVTACEAKLTRWDVFPRKLRLSGTQLCASVEGGVATLAALIKLRPCAADAQEQQFSFNARRIDYTDPQGGSLCLNVFSGLPQPGNKIGLWNGCGYFDNGWFHFAGPVKVGGRCLTQADDGLLATAPCSTSKKQVWDYHW